MNPQGEERRGIHPHRRAIDIARDEKYAEQAFQSEQLERTVAGLKQQLTQSRLGEFVIAANEKTIDSLGKATDTLNRLVDSQAKVIDRCRDEIKWWRDRG